MYKENSGLSNVRSSMSVRTEKVTPDGYRLAKKLSGEVVLQDAFFWQDGSNYGHEWKDIPMINLDR